MITRLILENFLAHGHTELDLGPGVTVISGPNNSGKSSLVEALRCLAQNPSPKYFIRHGAKEARVTVVLEDSTRVTWIRRPKYAMYEVLRPGAAEPETYAKFGRRPPEDVLALLKLENVVLEGMNEDVDVHLGDQRRPVFLLDRPGSAMASFFASSTEATHLVAMQQLLKTRRAQAKRDDSRLTTSMDRIQHVLDGLQSLPALQLEMETARELSVQAGNVRAGVPVLTARLHTMQGYAGRQAYLQARSEHLAQAVSPPALKPVKDLAACCDRMRRLQEQHDRLQMRLNALLPLAPLRELLPAAPLADLLMQRQELREVEVRMTVRCTWLRPLVPPAEPCFVGSLDHDLRSMIRLHRSAARLAARSVALQPLATSEEPRDTGTLQKTVRALREHGKKHRYLLGKKETLHALKTPPSLDDVQEIVSQLRRIAALRDRHTRISLCFKTYAPLHEEPAVLSFAPGERLLKRIMQQIRLEKKAMIHLDQLAAQEEELRGRLQKIAICPLCGGRVDVETVLGEGRG